MRKLIPVLLATLLGSAAYADDKHHPQTAAKAATAAAAASDKPCPKMGEGRGKQSSAERMDMMEKRMDMMQMMMEQMVAREGQKPAPQQDSKH